MDRRETLAQAAAGATGDVVALIEQGTAAFRRTNIAMFAAGFATFAVLYCVQALMPIFSVYFHVSAAESSLTLSLPNFLVAFAMLVASPLSDRFGRRPLMVGSILGSAILTLLSSVAPDWNTLLLLRALQGIVLAGLPAVAMAYLGEEMHPRAIGLAMGLYIGGSGLGGMSGRLLMGLVTDFSSWRVGLALIGAISLVAGLVLTRLLPPSRRFVPRGFSLRSQAATMVEMFHDRALPWLFLEAALLLGGQVATYNYIGYRLLAPPYDLSQSTVGFVFTVYLVGILSSAWVGDLASRLGRRRVLWAMLATMLAGTLITLAANLAVVIFGVALLTFGFFGGHTIASSWVGLRAGRAKAQASALYLFSYYMGSSVIGYVAGFFWSGYGWGGVVSMISVLLVAGLANALHLARVPPLAGRPT